MNTFCWFAETNIWWILLFDHFHLTDKIYEWSQRQRKAAEDALYETHGALSISIILVIVILFVGFVKLLKDSLRRCLMWGFPHRNENSTHSKSKHLIAVAYPLDNSWNLKAYFRYVTSRNAFCKTDGETVRKGKEGAAHIEKVCKKQGRCQNHSGCSCWSKRHLASVSVMKLGSSHLIHYHCRCSWGCIWWWKTKW